MAGTSHVASLSLVVLSSGCTSRAAFSIAAGIAVLDWNIGPGGSSPRARAFPLAINSGEDVKKAEESSSNRVANHRTFAWCHETRSLCQVKTKTAINNAKDDGDPAKPYVAVRPDCARVVALEVDMVQETQQRLECEQRKEHNADDRVSGVQCVEVPGHPDANAKSRGVEKKAEYLEQAVNPPETGE